ncbi:FMRFamide receptor [Aphelenchoides besseyi]|nr:FMRFamide receptor [Aphelenchoides besseyi]KAI6201785.1 FMRFamide receptor [Aphelenchoides besseyi]
MGIPGIPECLNKTLCREVMISSQVPLDWALPLYGYAMPIIVAITILTNSFIVLVLSHRYLRTPTNYVLLAMAVSELLTGLSCLPWLLYYYTFNGMQFSIRFVDLPSGYKVDLEQGLPSFWCTSFPYMATLIPSIAHTTATWLTVYLALQRCIYITLPKLVRSYCTIRRSKHAIATICIVSIWIFAPEFIATYNQTYLLENPRLNITRRACFRVRTAFIQLVGNDIYYYSLYGFHTVIAHILPCILLVCFTWKLIVAIRLADKRHAYLIARSGTKRKHTVESTEAFETEKSMRKSTRSMRQRTSLSESKRVQGLKQNTRMLIAVIILFLITEIPAALIFSVHVSAVALQIRFIQQHYALLNKLSIVRNVLIVISYPFRFAIYLGMGTQFRDVVRQMLTQRVFLPFGKRAQNLMKNVHHNNLPINIHSANQNTTVHEHTQLSEERKSFGFPMEEWTTTPRSSLMVDQFSRNEALIQVVQTTTPQCFFK